MARFVPAGSRDSFSVPTGQSAAVFCQDVSRVFRESSGGPVLLGTVSGAQQTFGPFAGDVALSIETEAASAFYSVGVAPVLRELMAYRMQKAPPTISANSSISLDALFSGLINGNAGLLGVTGTLPTGSALDAALDFRIDDAFEWSVMSTGLGSFIIGASAGHTIVGAAAVGSGQSGSFRTRKTGTSAFVTYRIS